MFRTKIVHDAVLPGKLFLLGSTTRRLPTPLALVMLIALPVSTIPVAAIFVGAIFVVAIFVGVGLI